jgi:hypothetical protein
MESLKNLCLVTSSTFNKPAYKTRNGVLIGLETSVATGASVLDVFLKMDQGIISASRHNPDATNS